MSRGKVHNFRCPSCNRWCKLEPGENRSAISHEVPECDVFRQHKGGRMMQFLQLAQAAANVVMIKPGQA